MERLTTLLCELESITFNDISHLPESKQHDVVEHLEQLQDKLKHALESSL